MSIEWRDLLAWPFERANCWQLAEEVCRRVGLALPALPPDWGSAADAVRPGLDPVSGATEVGDLIVSDPEKRGYASHVAVVVEPGVALSTGVECGPYAWPIRRHASTHGIWRPRR